MKSLKYLLFIISIFTLAGCIRQEPEIPVYVRESSLIKFYNNGDSTIQGMSLDVSFYIPQDGGSFTGTGQDKELNRQLPDSSYCLHPYDSLISNVGGPGEGIYIGCHRYVEFTVYDKDNSSESGYRLKGKYIINEVVRQKYVENSANISRKYPDNEITVNWPEDSLLFMNKQMMEQINLYPNPCYGLIRMRFPKNITSIEKIEVYDKSGNFVRSYPDIFVEISYFDKDSSSSSLDVSDLPQGNYIFKITTPFGTDSQAVTVKDRVYDKMF